MRAILVGSGTTTYYLSRALTARGYTVTVVCDDPQECTRLARRLRATVVVGDGSRPAVLEDARVREASLLLALTSSDATNLVCCQLALTRYAVPAAFAVANDPENEEVFTALGVPVALSPTRVVTNLMESRTQSGSVESVHSSLGGRVNLTEIRLPEDAPVSGLEVRKLSLPAGALLAALFRGESTAVPRGATVLRGGDRLLLVTTPEDYAAAVRVLVGDR